MCENNKLRISDAFNSRFLRFPCRFEKKTVMNICEFCNYHR